MFTSSKQHIPLWCDGKESAADDEWPHKRKKKCEDAHVRKVKDQEEVEHAFHGLKKNHGNKWSGLQYSLCARAIISGVHDSNEQPPNSPLFTGGLQKQQKESLTDAFASAATAIAKALSLKQSQSDAPVSSDVTATTQSVCFSSGKKVDIRMKNWINCMSYKT